MRGTTIDSEGSGCQSRRSGGFVEIARLLFVGVTLQLKRSQHCIDCHCFHNNDLLQEAAGEVVLLLLFFFSLLLLSPRKATTTMSKWLRRGFGHNNSTEASSHHQQQHQYLQQPQHHHSGSSNNNTSEFPSPPRNHLHPGTYHSEQQQQQPHLTGTANHTPNTSAAASSQPTMVGAYTTVQTAQQPSTTATIDMDVDTSTRDSKYSQVSPQQQHHHPYGGDMGGANSYHPHNTSMKQDPSGRMLDDRSARGRSGGSRMDRARLRQNQPPPPHHHYGSASQNNQVSAPPPQAPPLQPSQQQQSYHPHNRGATTTGATTTSAHFGPPPPHHHHGATPLTPYGSSSNANNINTSSGGKGIHTTSSPPDSAQPTYPPPAVTADSPQPSETAGSSSRRPAYLLHRDLVIGKGSYGQVCIASRGESEGHHTAARSGKRKKFACKCVMLRNDPKYIAKLQEEVNVLRELRGHDNVIRLYDVFCVDNELFIITELGRGGDLFHLLTTHPKHGVTEAYAGTFPIQSFFIFNFYCFESMFCSNTLDLFLFRFCLLGFLLLLAVSQPRL